MGRPWSWSMEGRPGEDEVVAGAGVAAAAPLPPGRGVDEVGVPGLAGIVGLVGAVPAGLGVWAVGGRGVEEEGAGVAGLRLGSLPPGEPGGWGAILDIHLLICSRLKPA